MMCRRVGIGRRRPEDRRVVALGRAGREEDLLGVGDAEMARPRARGPARPPGPLRRAGSYIELGLKYSVAKNGVIASSTSGATGVVALLSA